MKQEEMKLSSSSTPQQETALTMTTKKKSGVAADASFLETLTDQTSSILDLHRSNLLRLQAQELVEECSLMSSSSAASSSREKAPSWTLSVAPYVDQITQILQHDKLLAHLNVQELVASCPFDLKSPNLLKDPARIEQHLSCKTLRVVAPFAFTHGVLGRGSCCWTTKTGNAHVLPTFDVVVQLPNSMWETKDYAKHKYFDKRNLVVWHVAQSLAGHKKNRSKVGTVYYAYDYGDRRKPYLVLIPPTLSTSSEKPKQKKRKTMETAPTTTQLAVKTPKFRIRLLFEMESIDWIPPIRLLPNRCNLPQSQPLQLHHSQSNDNKVSHDIVASPMYNQALLEDAYHSFLLFSSFATKRTHKMATPRNNDNRTSDSDNDDDADVDEDEKQYPHWIETVVLAKIWCLQRGLLRAHDGFTTDQLALFILYLYRTKQANPRMAPLQVLAVFFKCWAETIWCHETQQQQQQQQQDSARKDDKNNLLRSSPHESQYSLAPTTARPTTSAAINKKGRKRAVHVLPLPGRTEEQTIAHAFVAKLYAKQGHQAPVAVGGGVGVKDPPTLVELYRQVFPGPVFLDSSMRYNYFGRLSPNFIQLVQHEASRSLLYLHSPSISTTMSSSFPIAAAVHAKPFEALFMNPSRFWERFDLYFKVPLAHFRTHTTTKIAQTTFSPAQQVDLGHYEALTRNLVHVLQHALGDRITSLRILSTGNGWLQHFKTSAQAVDCEKGQDHCEKRQDPSGNWYYYLDSDEIPYFEVSRNNGSSAIGSYTAAGKLLSSPRGQDSIVIGVSLNADNCHRVVDRGPPAENVDAQESFLDLWGKKSELRRFKDGAIVQAVVWTDTKNEPWILCESGSNIPSYTRYQNDDTMQGGIVERIILFILYRHFFLDLKEGNKDENLIVASPLRDMTSIIDGVVDDPSDPLLKNPALAHRNVMKAFEELASFLKEHSLPTLPIPGSIDEKTSRLGIPLTVDSVEPLSPSLRYAELFPPLPHSLAGGTALKGIKRTSGVIGSEPVCIQIRFGPSSKWPTDLKAIGAAKTAMLIQLANGIKEMRPSSPGECAGFANPTVVTPSYLDIGFRGYVFRIKVRADPEIRLLRSLLNPSEEAASMLQALARENVTLAMHHSMIHSITTKHASAGGVIRLATRWVAGHMLSDLVPFEAIELLVAKIYSDSSVLDPPGSVATGFLRFLQLLESHDWMREPLIVDPYGHIDKEDRDAIQKCFEQSRGHSGDGGPPMYIVSPNDRYGIDDIKTGFIEDGITTMEQKSDKWNPSFTICLPEWVVLLRTKALAKNTRAFLMSKLMSFDSNSWWSAFHESEASFKGFNALLRIDPALIVDDKSSSTGKELGPAVSSNDHNLEFFTSSYSSSMRDRYVGPRALTLKLYRNILDNDSERLLHDWRPVDLLVHSLRARFGSLALFFYNNLCPHVIAILWRPRSFSPHPFSVVTGEYAQPSFLLAAQTMVIPNTNDILREMGQYFNGVVAKVKLFTASPMLVPPKTKEHGSDGDSSSSSE